MHSLASLASLLVLGSCLGACRNAPAPKSAAPAETSSHARAEALAGSVVEHMGGRDAWERTRYISWNFMRGRRHTWDKHTGDLRLESGNRVCLMNVGTRAGRVFENGVEVADAAERAKLLERAYAAFINDSYWMFMPYKLRDPGVHLEHRGDSRTNAGHDAEVLDVTFEEVGMTPRNRYHVFVGKESGLVEQWDYYEDRDDVTPRLSSPWNGWKRFGEILLCTDHGDGKDWEIAVSDDLPRSVFEEP